MIERTSIHRAKRDLHVLLIALLIISLVLPVGTVAAATSSATIIEIKGDVQIIRGGSEKSFAAFKDMRLTEGDKIITGPNSSAKIELENDNAVLTLSENTRIYLSELKGQGDDQQTSINLQAGGIGSKVKKALSSVSRFNIKTPTATMGVRGTQFYTQYRDGDVDIRVLNGLVDVTIGASNAPVDEGAGDDPGAPPTDGTGLGVTDPDDPGATDPGTNTGAGGAAFSYTLGAMQQMGFNDGASPDQLGGLAAEPFSLGGLDETFIGDLEDQAASDPDSVPPGLLDDALAARDQARERSKERQGREGQAPREQDEKPGERGREIARSTPNTGDGQAPNVIDQTPQTIPPGGHPGSTTTPPPAPTYDDDDGGDDYYEPTPPTEPTDPACPEGHYQVTFSVVGGGGTIFASLIENDEPTGEFTSGSCHPVNTLIEFYADADYGYQVEEWRINGNLVATDAPYTEQMLEGPPLWQDLNITVEFKLDGQSTPQYKLTYSEVDNTGGTLYAQTSGEMPLDSGSDLDGETEFFFIAEANEEKNYEIKQWLINGDPFMIDGRLFTDGYLNSEQLDSSLLEANLEVRVEFIQVDFLFSHPKYYSRLVEYYFEYYFETWVSASNEVSDITQIDFYLNSHDNLHLSKDFSDDPISAEKFLFDIEEDVGKGTPIHPNWDPEEEDPLPIKIVITYNTISGVQVFTKIIYADYSIY